MQDDGLSVLSVNATNAQRNIKTLSALPVTRRCSAAGLKDTARISLSWAWILVDASVGALVSQLEIIQVRLEINRKNAYSHHEHFVVPHTGKDILFCWVPVDILSR